MSSQQTTGTTLRTYYSNSSRTTAVASTRALITRTVLPFVGPNAGLGTQLIAGIVSACAAVVLLMCVLLLGVCASRRRKRRHYFIA